MNDKIFDKIKKCLALANSSNPNEAATALRQAQALMKKHEISTEDIQLSDVKHYTTQASRAKNPPNYNHVLVGLIMRVFGVEAYYQRDFFSGMTHIRFIGINDNAQIAGYAFDVLQRQLNKARREYLKTLKRFKTANKTRKADVFSEAWVFGAAEKVSKFVRSEKEEHIIGEYMNKKHEHLKESKPRKHKEKSTDGEDRYAGYMQGKKASLNHGVNESKQGRLTCN